MRALGIKQSEAKSSSHQRTPAQKRKASLIHPVAGLENSITQRTPGCACGGGCPRCTHLQTKLKVNRPGDRYEHEADSIAEQVMRMSPGGGATGISALAQTVTPLVQRAPVEAQRQEEEAEEEEDDLETPAQAQLIEGIQAQEEETEEEEEDLEVPAQAKLIEGVQAQEEETEEKEEDLEVPVQTKLIEGIQAQEEDAEEEEPEDSAVFQTKGTETALAGNGRAAFNPSRTGGQPLPQSARSFFEPRFGASFENVRIHTNDTASEGAQAINAKAFTIGRDIYFNTGQFQPDGEQGRRLLAHELTHTIQQKGVDEVTPQPESDTPTARISTHTGRGSIIQRNENGEEPAEDFDLNPRGGSPGAVSEDEVLETSSFNLEGLVHVDDANLSGTSGAAETTEGGEESTGFECPNILTPITEFAGQETSAVSEEQRFPSLVSSYLPSPYNAIVGGAAGMAAFFWNRLPLEVKAEAINAMIDAASGLVARAPENLPTDRYAKIALTAFLGRLRRVPNERKVRIAEKLGSILLGTNVSFAWGMLKGVIIGFFVDGLLGIIQMIIDIICLIPMFFQFVDRILRFIEMFPEAVRETIRSILELKERVQEALDNAIEDLIEIYHNPQRIFEFLNRIDEQAREMAGRMGERAAERMLQAFETPAERLGYVVGRVIGVILFEVVMAIISAILTFYIGGAGAAGSAAVSAGKTALRAFMSALRRAMRFIMKMIRPIVRLVSGWIDKVKDFVLGLGRVLTQAWGRVARSLSRLLDRVKGLFQRFLTLIGANRFFLEYIARVRAMTWTPRFRLTGVRRELLWTRVIALRNRPRFLRVVGLPRVKAADNRGFWIVKVNRRPLPIKIAIAEAKMDSRSRMDFAKRFIQEEVDDIPDRRVSDAEIEDEIRPYKNAYDFSTLYSEYDAREDDFDVKGGMSPDEEVASRDSPWPTGEREDPIPIRWFRRGDVYPTIEVHEVDEGGVARVSSGGLRRGITLPATARRVSRFIRVLATNLRPRVAMQKLRERGSESKKNEIGRRLRDNANIKVIAPGGDEMGGDIYRIDHVRELKFGGQDEYNNLWPVHWRHNDAFNANFNQFVRVQDSEDEPRTMRITRLNLKWFKVADVAGSVPSSKGGHDTTRLWPSNRGVALGGVRKKFPRRRRRS